MSDLCKPGSDCSSAKQCLFSTTLSIISKYVNVFVGGLKLIQTFEQQTQAETQPGQQITHITSLLTGYSYW